jgi:hypothetical protein
MSVFRISSVVFSSSSTPSVIFAFGAKAGDLVLQAFALSDGSDQTTIFAPVCPRDAELVQLSSPAGTVTGVGIVLLQRGP